MWLLLALLVTFTFLDREAAGLERWWTSIRSLWWRSTRSLLANWESEAKSLLLETHRETVTLPAGVVTTIREDTVFIPYHWADEKSANLLTIRALDPVSKMPEFKVCACRVMKAN